MTYVKTFFIADLHFGHKNILTYQPERKGFTIEEHDKWLIDQWNSVVRPKDIVWVLGDVAFGKGNIHKIVACNGTKKLVLGNHDYSDMSCYTSYFSQIYGVTKWHNFWLSHGALHESSLRGLRNIHGHSHSRKIDDDRYICVSVEHSEGKPRTIEELINGI